MDKADFADNKEYITVMVYKSGKKIHLPNDPKPLVDGARINSPHYLCQLKVTEPGVQKYTLVVAQVTFKGDNLRLLSVREDGDHLLYVARLCQHRI